MAEDYARDILRQSVARTCLALDITSASPEVIDCLADVTRHYIQTLGKNSSETAELSSRTQVGFQDVLNILGTSRLKDSKWQDLREFAAPSSGSSGWNQPFPFDVPNFPEPSKKSYSSSKDAHGSASRRSYVPESLPPFPPSHTYSSKLKVSKSKRKSDKMVEMESSHDKRVRRIEISTTAAKETSS